MRGNTLMNKHLSKEIMKRSDRETNFLKGKIMRIKKDTQSYIIAALMKKMLQAMKFFGRL